ncbi:MAG: hypothetical protein D6812_02475, partial [Deltaproteobacteria bacterium]
RSVKTLGILESLHHFHPEFFLSLTFVGGMLLMVFLSERDWDLVGPATLAGVLVAFTSLFTALPLRSGRYFSGVLFLDPMTQFGKALLLLLAAGVLGMLVVRDRRGRVFAPQGYLFLTLALLSMLFLLSANDLLLLLLSLEGIGMASVLLALHGGGEAAECRKALFRGMAASIFLFTAVAGLHGLCGASSFHEIARVIAKKPVPSSFLLPLLLLLSVGFFAKTSLLPPFRVHAWRKTPTPVAFFLAGGILVAGVMGFMRLFFTLFLLWEKGAGRFRIWTMVHEFPWSLALSGVALLSMTVANVGALFTREVKGRLLYATAAFGGYALLPLVFLNGRGAILSLHLLTLLVVTILGVSWGLILFDEGRNWRGMGRKMPIEGFFTLFFLLALVAVPLLARWERGEFLVRFLRSEPFVTPWGSGGAILVVLFLANVLIAFVSLGHSAISLFRAPEGELPSLLHFGRAPLLFFVVLTLLAFSTPFLLDLAEKIITNF